MRMLALERLDPLEPAHDGARLVQAYGSWLHAKERALRCTPSTHGRLRREMCQLPRGLLAGAEQLRVELAQQRAPVAVLEHRDERAANDIGRGLAELLGVGLVQKHGGAHRGSPCAVAVAERRIERVPKLLTAERVVLEERQLPPVERVAEPRVAVGERELRDEPRRDLCSERIEAR